MTTNRTQFDHPDGFDEAPKIWIFVLALSIGGAERTIVEPFTVETVYEIDRSESVV